jgi:hypothetical protein
MATLWGDENAIYFFLFEHHGNLYFGSAADGAPSDFSTR